MSISTSYLHANLIKKLNSKKKKKKELEQNMLIEIWRNESHCDK